MQEQVNFEIPAYLKVFPVLQDRADNNGQFMIKKALPCFSLFTFTQVAGTHTQRQKQGLWRKKPILTIMVKSV